MDLRGDWSSACPALRRNPRRNQVAPVFVRDALSHMGLTAPRSRAAPREPLIYSRVRDGGDFRAGRDSGRRRVLDAHKAADGEAMDENSTPSLQAARSLGGGVRQRPRRLRVAAGSPRQSAYVSARTRAPALLLGLAISTYRCGRAPSRRRVPAATRMRVNRPEAT